MYAIVSLCSPKTIYASVKSQGAQRSLNKGIDFIIA